MRIIVAERNFPLRKAAFAGSAMLALMAAASAAGAAEVSYQRLLHPEPQNWLMNHHDFSSQRFSPLASINKSNAKNLKLAFAVPLGGNSGNEYTEATPLVDDGFLFITDVWGVLYKIDVRSGALGRIVWKMDPGQEKMDRNRGVALWGNLVVSVTGQDGRVIATDKETGKIVWDKNLKDQTDLELTAAPLALKDQIIIGASGGDLGVRDWIAALDPTTGAVSWKTFIIPAPNEPGGDSWKDKNNAWATGGGAFYVTGSYDPDSNLTYWGSGNPVPRYDSSFRPGDNLYTASAVAFDAATGKISWFHQYTPNDNRDYDETGTHILIDTKVNGEDRKILSHAGRNGFEYTFDRTNGQFLKAVQYVGKQTWTKGIDPKTGKPLDYDPSKDLQYYAGTDPRQKMTGVCPDVHGGNNFWPAAYSQKTRLVYIPGNESCVTITPDPTQHIPGKFTGGGYVNEERVTSRLTMIDPASGELKKFKDLPYGNLSGVLATSGGIIVTALLDGTVLALDDETLETLWSINLGAGFAAPPMSYAVDGKQYIAIASGIGGVGKQKLSKSPEMKNQPNATMLFVFGL
jgi:alcohol dehydrogenase (cytochrome c)